ncbi:RagB/SusD family nutrient uptake outer membrane protein [Parapedobacter indicus]|uniref:Starch-binding associating with outer membrane n=1 Tax=Parapedobacter indicus TaxID=1477437 RepID=A0A1I3PS35_9SPHI|nr:RagB/SusD family nutrient uptake outer membrane protein [Parapedobacter indicus]PPL00555.1 putative outer membrane starch-binding protein [Parapedobacter indicus]SFJ24428.1 Starch-binding associating with outer membrane [Parapedobacter indicus]
MKKSIYNLSKKWPALTLLGLLLSPSCSKDILTEVPLDFLAPENAYQNVEGIRQGITGLHYNVRETWYYADDIYLGSSRQDPFAILIGSLGTDVAFHGENPGGNRKLVNYRSEMTSQDPQFTYFWVTSYQIIQQANVLIAGIEKSDLSIWNSEDQKNQFLAEALFFRCWMYRLLVPLYGDVPLVTEAINTVRTDFIRTPKAEIYQLLERDLTFAGEHLPARGSEEAPGRITKGAAWHTLAEIYLNQSKFEDAIDAASKVIDGAGYALMTRRFGSTPDVFGSGDPFLDLFTYGNQNLAENREAIWVIQLEPLVVGGRKFPGDRGWGPAYFRMGNTPDGFPAFRGEMVNGQYTGYSDTLGRPVSWIKPTNYAAYDIWRSDWNNDIRNAKHNIKRDFYFDNPASKYHKQKIDFGLYPPGSRNAMRDTCQYIYPYFLKHASPLQHFTDPAQSGAGWTHKDVYVIRLAETILLRAEAYIGLGNLELAAADINAIRERAHAKPVAAAEVDIDYLLDERARELYGEEFRHITLRRVGKLLERVRKYNNNPIYPACNIQDYNVLFPIPQSQIDLNIDHKMEQNPGY